MNPAKYAIKYKQLTLVILLIFLTAGVFSFVNMPRQEDPDMTPPVAQILTIYPGASPLQVEQLVTSVIEAELNEITEIDLITSVSGRGYSNIFIELDYTVDADKVWDETREKLNQVRDDLPAEAEKPSIDTDLLKTVTSMIAISGYDEKLINQVASSLKSELLKISAIAKIELAGEKEKEVLITLDEQELSQYHLSLDQVINAVKANNINIPGSTIDLGSLTASLTTPNLYEQVDELNLVVVDVSSQGWPLNLSSIATIEALPKDNKSIIRTNGQSAVILEVSMRDGENVVRLGEEINQAIAQAKASAPENIHINLIADQPGDVDKRLSNFGSTLLFGMVLVVLTVLITMGWRNALVIAVAIPLSVTLAFAGMGMLNISLHQVSIAALVIALGILVDNTIVINDNIYRHWHQGTSPLESCTKGLKEVAIPVLSSTLTTIAAFTPLAIMSGDVGQFVKAIPQVVSLTLVSSLIISTTITPLMFYMMIKNKNPEEFTAAQQGKKGVKSKVKANLNLNLLVSVYQSSLTKAVKHPKTTLSTAVLFLIAAGFLIPRLGVEFFPPSDKEMVIVQVSAPTGTSLEKTDQTIAEIEKFLKNQPEVVNFTSFVGRGVPKFYYNILPGPSNSNSAQVLINLDAKGDSISLLATDWQNQLQNKLGEARIRIDLMEQGPPVGAPVSYRISGPDLEVLAKLADEAVEILRDIPGTTAQSHGLEQQQFSLDVNVDLDTAAMHGISRANVASTLRYLNERQEISSIQSSGTDEIPIKLSLSRSAENPATLESLWIASDLTGQKVQLGQVASLVPTWEWTSINHRNGARTVYVNSYLESGVSANEVVSQATPLIRQIELPPGYSLMIGGETEEQIASFSDLGQAGITAVLLIYLILIFQFNSLKQPLLIIASIPFTVIGAVAGLYLLSFPIGFMAFLGLVSLVGIVVNNAIVLVDFINCRRREGLSIDEAIVKAGKQRLRPILLTTATTVGGLLPLSLTGGNLWGPMGFAIIFGLTGSTLLTLIVLPVLYVLAEGRKDAQDAPVKQNNVNI